MTVTVKNKTPLVAPPVVRRQAGFKGGDELEFKVSGGVITILAKPPAADDEYTPAQRRAIDRGIAKGLEDIRRGRTHGPFSTAGEAIPHLKTYARQRRRKASQVKPSRSQLFCRATPRSAAAGAPAAVQSAYYKQLRFIASGLKHPSLRAKKYNDAQGLWQGRVNKNWRFYFTVAKDTCFIVDVVPHPK